MGHWSLLVILGFNGESSLGSHQMGQQDRLMMFELRRLENVDGRPLVVSVPLFIRLSMGRSKPCFKQFARRDREAEKTRRRERGERKEKKYYWSPS
jgi:hypothetical protein